MSSISIISFIGCFLIIAITIKLKTDIFSPAKVFAFVWLLAIGLTDLKLSRLQHEWPPLVWIQLLIGPLAFLIGAGLIYSTYINRSINPIGSMRNNRSKFSLNNNRVFIAAVVLSILFIFSYLIIYFNTGEIPLFSPKPGVARANFTMFGIGLFLHNVVLIVFLTAIYMIFERNNNSRKVFLAILSLISSFLYILTLQRYQIFLTILLLIVLLYYTTYHVKFKTTIIISIVLIIFFFLVSSFRAGEVIILVLYKISQMKYSPEYAIFTEPYMYVTMNLENFARSIEKTEQFTYGYYTFDFVTAISGLKHWISEYFDLVENPFLISSYNTYSAFWTYFRDFGIVGLFTIPFLGGAGISSLYHSMREKPTLLKISLYGMLLYGVIFSFFNSVFGFLWFVYNIIALLIVFKFISK